MYDVILYAAIATVVCAMLYSVLGKQVGKGPDEGFDPNELFKSDETKPEDNVVQLEPKSPIPGLSDVMKADQEFSPGFFIDGAKQAYSMILEAFASGDRDQLKELLSPDVYSVYAAAIDERESKNLTQVTDLGRLLSAKIVQGQVENKKARVSVEFEAEVSSALLDADGQTIEGDPDILANVSEVWTFERGLQSKEPNWFLADVASSTGEELSADPTPDTTD